MAPSVSAQSARKGVQNGTVPPLAAPAAETPKISTGTVKGRISTAISRPPRRRLTVSAAPMAPMKVSAGVPTSSEAATPASAGRTAARR